MLITLIINNGFYTVSREVTVSIRLQAYPKVGRIPRTLVQSVSIDVSNLGYRHIYTYNNILLHLGYPTKLRTLAARKRTQTAPAIPLTMISSIKAIASASKLKSCKAG